MDEIAKGKKDRKTKKVFGPLVAHLDWVPSAATQNFLGQEVPVQVELELEQEFPVQVQVELELEQGFPVPV